MTEQEELIFLRKEVSRLKKQLVIIEWMTSGTYRSMSPEDLMVASKAHKGMFDVLHEQEDET